MSQEFEVIVNHKGERKTYSLRKGLNFQALATKERTPLEFDCRKADCGICIFTVIAGAENLSPMTPAEKDFLKAMRAAPNERLACQVRVFGPVEIEVESFD